MNQIYYNNNSFEGICYTPFVSYSLESDGYISAKELITLHGEILADCESGISGIFLKQKNLLNNYSKNYSKFEIKEDSKTIFSCDYAVVKSINFEESDYAYIVPFSIDLECYEKDFFSGNYGVYDLENSFDFQEQDDQSVIIEHTVSAKGFNNKNSAIYNAVNWVYSNSGLANIPQTALINLNNGNLPFLIEVTETIDRFNGSCSITEIYAFDQANIGSGLVRYSADIKTDKKEFNTISLKGSVEMGRYGSISAARNRYKQLNLYNIAAHIYRKSTGLNDLSAIILKYSINEDLIKNSLNFTVEFNNDNSSPIQVVSEASIERGNNLLNNKYIASIRSRITYRDGIKSQRFQEVKDYFDNKYNPVTEFQKNMSFFNYDIGLFRHTEDNVVMNEKEAYIEYNCSWSVLNVNKFLPCYVKGGDLKLEVGPRLNDYNFVPVLCPNWAAFFKGYKWAYARVAGQLTVYPGNESSALSWARTLSSQAGGVETFFSESSSEGNVSFEYRKEQIG